MATVFGILFLIGAAFWTLVTVRALPGSTTHIAGQTLTIPGRHIHRRGVGD